MKEKDYYGILGVEKTADEKKIKQAYRKLAKKYHPDTNAGNAQAEKRFQEISEAYEVLSDPKKKELYDKYGTMGLQEGFDAAAYEAYRRAGQSGFGGFSGLGSRSSFCKISSCEGLIRISCQSSPSVFTFFARSSTDISFL